MGGSHLAADVLLAACTSELQKPVTIVSEPDLPQWVTPEMLVVACSYSGTTEETISCAKQALQRNIPTVVITTGGQLAAMNVPKFVFTPTANPANQPRLGVAYSLTAMLKILVHVGALRAATINHDRLILQAQQATKRWSAMVDFTKNTAKQLALQLFQHQPLLLSTARLSGNMHVLQNQIHENAKTFASFFTVPELNHHLMEGLRNPIEARRTVVLAFLDPEAGSRIMARWKFTMAILKRLGITIASYRFRGATSLERAVEVLAFGGYVSWYLAALRKVNPSLIPTVDELKKKMRSVK
jgi:glucose/mannose-6-phosphate isomerase